MAPEVTLEPLRNGVLALAVAVIALALFLLIDRGVVALSNFRRKRREPILSRLLFQTLQSSPVDASAFLRLGPFDRQLVRSILLGLALDLRGDTDDAIATLYRDLGFIKNDLSRQALVGALLRCHGTGRDRPCGRGGAGRSAA